MLPQVARLLSRSTQLLAQARAVARREGGPSLLRRDEVSSSPPTQALVEALLHAAGQQAARIVELGARVEDLERGRIDFHSVLEGEREVLLCWELGEAEIRWFHELHGSYVSREPIYGHRFFKSRQLVPPSST